MQREETTRAAFKARRGEPGPAQVRAGHVCVAEGRLWERRQRGSLWRGVGRVMAQRGSRRLFSVDVLQARLQWPSG